MPNLKIDLLDKLQKDKYYAELELVRLAADPNMNYKDKVEQMQWKLDGIALLNADMNLVEQYFKEPQPAPQAAPPQAGAPVANAPQGAVHPGQTHGE
jgi:hypothetical protein